MGLEDFLLPSLAWQSITPELVLLLFGLLAPLVALWDTDRKGMKQFTLIGLGGAFLLSLGSLLGWNANIPGVDIRFTLEYVGSQLGDGKFVITEATQLFKAIFAGVAFLAVLGSDRPFKGNPVEDEDMGEFYALILFATLGMFVVASAREFMLMLLGIEIASMTSYLLAGFRRNRFAAEGSLKYFTIGAVSSSLMLVGISFLYGIAGTTTFEGVSAAMVTGGDFDAMTLMPILLVFAGLGFKLSATPFHAWAPDVYTAAPSPVTGMLAAASKAMAFLAILLVFVGTFGGVQTNWELIVAVIAVISMTVGNLMALRQTSISRMLAYSSVAQAGYLLIAIAVGTWYAAGAGVLHVLVNAGMKLGAFLIVGAMIQSGFGDSIAGWKGLAKRNGFLAFAMTLFLLSMAGFPPLGGFVSKFILFSSAIDVATIMGEGWLVWLVVIAVVNSAASLVYYWRLIRTMYVDDVAEEDPQPVTMTLGQRLSIFVLAAFVVVVGLFPQPFVDVSMAAGRSLLGF